MIFCVLVLFGSKGYALDQADSLYKVLKIKSEKNYYIIHLGKQDSLFKLISKKEPLDLAETSREILTKGKSYYFNFRSPSDKELVGSLDGIANYRDVKNAGFFVEGKLRVKFTKRFHYRLYTTDDLIGFYHMPTLN